MNTVRRKISLKAKSSLCNLSSASLPFILFSSFRQLLSTLGNFSNIYIWIAPLSFQSIYTIIRRQDSERLGKFLGQWNRETETGR